MAYTVSENGGQYDRGVAAGEISQRLKEHDTHLAKINGSMGDVARENAAVARELNGVKMQLQRMADSMQADRETVLSTAAALEKERASTATALATEKTTLKETSDRRWSPLARLTTAIVAISAIAALLVLLFAHVTFH